MVVGRGGTVPEREIEEDDLTMKIMTEAKKAGSWAFWSDFNEALTRWRGRV